MKRANPSQRSEESRQATANSRMQDFGGADYRRRLFDEYKILQDKMDKIGAFRFTIKGWAVTAIGAVFGAASAVGDVQTAALTVSPILAVMVVFFFSLEVEQVSLSKLFGDRAHFLEKTLKSMDRGRHTGSPEPVPYIAHEISKAHYQRVLADKGRSAGVRLAAKIRELWVIGGSAHRWFYVTLLVITMVPVLRNSGEISRSLAQTATQMSEFTVSAMKSAFSLLPSAR